MTLYLCCAAFALVFLLAVIVAGLLLRHAPTEQWPGQYG